MLDCLQLRLQTLTCLDPIEATLTCIVQTLAGIFSYTPEPYNAFCPINVHPLFPVFEPHVQKWIIFVRRCPLTFQNIRQSVWSVWSVFAWNRRPPKAGGFWTLLDVTLPRKKKVDFGTTLPPPLL